MCSVTFWPGTIGYLLGMNRDESLARVDALPPVRCDVNDRSTAAPQEPGGGSWISLNDLGVSLALVNWYAVPTRATPPRESRGRIVPALGDCANSAEFAGRMTELDLTRADPFRLAVIFPGAREVEEWRWDRIALVRLRHDWAPRQWLSSGFDEPTAQRVRSATFRAFEAAEDAGSCAWLRRLHGSHLPERGPFSTCMHRADAATVSYTEIEVGPDAGWLRYAPGPPCLLGDIEPVWIPRGPSPCADPAGRILDAGAPPAL